MDQGAVKTVPAQWLPGPRELRAWTLAAGVPEADRYLLGLDPHAPHPFAVGLGPDAGGNRSDLIGTRGCARRCESAAEGAYRAW